MQPSPLPLVQVILRRLNRRRRSRSRSRRLGLRVPVQRPARQQHANPIIIRPGTQIGVNVPIVLAELGSKSVTAGLDLRRLILVGTVGDPFEGGGLVLLDQDLARGQQAVARLRVVQLGVLGVTRCELEF